MTLKQLLIIILTAILIVGGYYTVKLVEPHYKTFFSTQEKQLIVSENPQPADKEGEVNSLKIVNEVDSYRLPSGDQLYNISHGDEVEGPRAEKIEYSPLAFEPNKLQTITVTFPDKEEVSSGVIFITTDRLENQKVTLKKLDDSKNEWQGEWVPTDTINTRYNARLYFVGSSGTYSNVMNFL